MQFIDQPTAEDTAAIQALRTTTRPQACFAEASSAAWWAAFVRVHRVPESRGRVCPQRLTGCPYTAWRHWDGQWCACPAPQKETGRCRRRPS